MQRDGNTGTTGLMRTTERGGDRESGRRGEYKSASNGGGGRQSKCRGAARRQASQRTLAVTLSLRGSARCQGARTSSTPSTVIFPYRTVLARRRRDGEDGLERPNAADDVVALEFLHRGAALLRERALSSALGGATFLRNFERETRPCRCADVGGIFGSRDLTQPASVTTARVIKPRWRVHKEERPSLDFGVRWAMSVGVFKSCLAHPPDELCDEADCQFLPMRQFAEITERSPAEAVRAREFTVQADQEKAGNSGWMMRRRRLFMPPKPGATK
jgi:hypothetical protein